MTVTSPKTWVAYSTLNTGIGSKDPLGGGGDWFSQGTIVANITELLKSRTVQRQGGVIRFDDHGVEVQHRAHDRYRPAG